MCGVAAALFAIVLTVAGCASRATSAPPPSRLIFTGLVGEPDSLDPLVSPSADEHNLSHLYLSYLVESDDRGALIPEIAQIVPTQRNGGISADGTTIVYHLRAGVTWQDGAPLTARDVVFSYRAVMNPANDVVTRVGFDQIASVTASGPRTVVVRMRRPYAPIIAYFFGPEGFPIVPQHVLAKYPNINRVPFNTLPMGSGPYRVVSWKHGDTIAFAANPHYWRGAPHIARLVYRLIPDSNTRLQVLASGDADAYIGADPQLLPQLRALGGVRIVETPANLIHDLQFNVKDPVVGDVRVRAAIAFAIDRRKLIMVATHDSGLDDDSDQPRDGWAYAPGGPHYPYDPARARALLDAAGWHAGPGGMRARDGRPLAIGLATSPQGINGSMLVATALQRYLHDVGIAVTIKQYTPGLMWEPRAAGGVLAGGRYQAAYNAWWIEGPDPDDSWQFGCDQIAPAGYNNEFWCNRRADAAMTDAKQTFDLTRRKRDYAIVQAELRRDLPEVSLWQVRLIDVVRTNLRGFSPSPAGSTFWNAWRWSLGP